MRNLIIIVALLLFSISGSEFSYNDRDEIEEPCKEEKYQTSEPGTCLSKKAYILLQAISKFEKNPYNNEFTKQLMDIIEPKTYKTVDKVIEGNESNVHMRIYYPTKRSYKSPTQIVLFIHGGGFILGSVEEYDMAVKKFAKVTNKIIVSVDYRLAPEHPYPAGLNDVEAALNWVSANYREIGGESNKIFVMGDSAGGNLAAVLALKKRDEAQDFIAGQILYYPATTLVEHQFPSRVYFLEKDDRYYLLTKEFVYHSKHAYLPDSTYETNPYVSPLEDPLDGKIPPALVITAQVDPLRDDGREYAEKLRKKGHDVSYMEYKGIIHGFFNFYMLLDEGKKSMKLVGKFIDDKIKEQAS